MQTDPQLYLHPLIELTAIALALVALWLGLARVRSLHLGQDTSFKRKWHMRLGTVALLMMHAGFIGGLYMVRTHWDRPFMTGDHAWVGLTISLLAGWGLFSGWFLRGFPAPRKLVPALHGLGNLILVGLALWQIKLGYEVLRDFVWGV